MDNLVGQHKMRVTNLGERLPHPKRQLDQAMTALSDRIARLTACRLATERMMAQGAERGDELLMRLNGALQRYVEQRAHHLGHVGKLLESCSYERVLERGFVLVHDEAGRPLTSARETEPGAALALRFHDGEVGVRVDGAGAKSRPARGERKTARDVQPTPKQGSLL